MYTELNNDQAIGFVHNAYYEQADVTRSDELATAIEKALLGRRDLAGGIGLAMLELIETLRVCSPKDIKESKALIRIFGTEVKGRDVSMLAQWVEAHTPIRVRFDSKTGRFVDIGWNKKRVAASKTNPLTAPAWDMKGLSNTNWDDYKPENRKATSKPDIQRGIDSVVREAARMLDTDGTVTLAQIKASIMEQLVDGLAANILAEQEKEKHEEFVAKFKKDHADK